MHFISQHFPCLVLQCVDLFISQAPFHAAICYAIAVTGPLLHDKTNCLAIRGSDEWQNVVLLLQLPACQSTQCMLAKLKVKGMAAERETDKSFSTSFDHTGGQICVK